MIVAYPNVIPERVGATQSVSPRLSYELLGEVYIAGVSVYQANKNSDTVTRTLVGFNAGELAKGTHHDILILDSTQ
jgi:hypothetical protein